jgi:hypothetical protein
VNLRGLGRWWLVLALAGIAGWITVAIVRHVPAPGAARGKRRFALQRVEGRLNRTVDSVAARQSSPDPAALVRTALHLATDPNVITWRVDDALRALHELEEQAQVSWDDAAVSEGIDPAKLEAAIAAAYGWGLERSPALDDLVGDWTRSGALHEGDAPFASSAPSPHPAVAARDGTGPLPDGGRPTIPGLDLRDVRLESPRRVAPSEDAAFVARDALESPRIDASALATWRRFLGPFGGVEVRTETDGWTLVGVPRLAFHVWGRTSDGRWVHFRRGAGDDVVVADGDDAKPLVARPVVDGAPVPDGTVLIPGRLDLAVARGMAVRPCRAAGVSHFVHARSDFPNVRLAGSKVLTAIHPQHGVAWLRFDGRSAPTGAWERGEIVVRSPDGRPLRWWIGVESGSDVPLVGGYVGDTRPVGLDDPTGAREFVVRGLPPGDYTVTFSRVERQLDGATSVDSRGHASVTIDAEHPRVEVVEPRAGR